MKQPLFRPHRRSSAPRPHWVHVQPLHPNGPIPTRLHMRLFLNMDSQHLVESDNIERTLLARDSPTAGTIRFIFDDLNSFPISSHKP